MKEWSYTSALPMGRTACTEPQCLYKGALYLYLNIRCVFCPELAAYEFSFILKMEAAASSEQLASFHQATRRHIPDYGPLQ
jgi:hypothetical protein